MREATDPAAHELFDLCLTRFVSRDGLKESVHGHLAFDYLYRFRFPEAVREDIFDFLAASLFAAGESVSGLSKVRNHPGALGPVVRAAPQEEPRGARGGPGPRPR